MIRRGKQIIKNHMTLDYEYTGIRLQDGFLTPVTWKLDVNLIASEHKSQTKQDVENKAGLAYQKLYFWLETNLPGIVAVNATNEDDLYLANLTSNIVMLCPGNPGDDILIKLLHSKLSALSGNDLILSEITLRGSDTSLHYTYDCEDGDYGLPANTSDYCPESIIRDKEPWWTRDDGFCTEFLRPMEEKEQGEDSFSDIVDPMTEFFRIIEEVDSHILVKEPAKIVQVEKWKPRKVEE